MSASSDKILKLWDLRQTKTPVKQLTLSHPVEDFCFLPSNQAIIANGSTLSQVNTDDLTLVKDFYPFQKPALKVRYDASRQRILAAGLDSQLKVFKMEE